MTALREIKTPARLGFRSRNLRRVLHFYTRHTSRLLWRSVCNTCSSYTHYKGRNLYRSPKIDLLPHMCEEQTPRRRFEQASKEIQFCASHPLRNRIENTAPAKDESFLRIS